MTLSTHMFDEAGVGEGVEESGDDDGVGEAVSSERSVGSSVSILLGELDGESPPKPLKASMNTFGDPGLLASHPYDMGG